MTNTPPGSLEELAQTPPSEAAGALLNATVVGNVKGELRKRNLTYEVFAPRVGMTRSTFAQRMAGNTAISLPELGAIALELDLEPAKLLND